MKSSDIASDATSEFSPEDSETAVARGRRHWFRSGWLQGWFPFFFLFLLAACLRFWDLGVRPLHWDESLHGYFSLQMLDTNIKSWYSCIGAPLQGSCYRYTPLLHGPFQFFAIAFVYGISQLLHVADNGVNTTTVRIAAALLGSLMVILPYYVQDYLGRIGSILASLFLTLSPSFVYYSRFAREDIYMAFFTLWMVVSFARYVRERKLRWLMAAAAALTLSYATNEATFLTIAILGSFLLAVIVWELFVILPFGNPRKRKRYVPRTNAPLALGVYFVTFVICARILLSYISTLSLHMSVSGAVTQEVTGIVDLLKLGTECVWPFLILALIFFTTWFIGRGDWRLLQEQRREQEQQDQVQERRRRRRQRIRAQGWRRIFITDRERQPLLSALLEIPRLHWLLVGTLCALIFTMLFSALFTYFPDGPADGVWQGLFYWIKQQQLARGAQPWFYYPLLIFLYEQIGLVFGIVGIIRSLRRPTAFRLFLSYWFVGSLIIYTWAGEKMPWLVIHIMLPLLLLAALGLEPVLLTVGREIRAMRERWRARSTSNQDKEAGEISPEEVEAALVARRMATRRSRWSLAGSLAACLVALSLLTLTLQNMYQLSFVHAAEAPYEMMIYVQTTTSVNTVLARVSAVDRFLDKGNGQLSVGVTTDSTWPFAWYLRDDSRVCYIYTPQATCGSTKTPPVIITAADDVSVIEKADSSDYIAQEYQIRSQWDQGYMPPACKSTPGHTCGSQPYIGVGLLLWLSYGDHPPAHAQFNLILTMTRIWNWWWYREPLGSTTGSYNMWLLIRKDVVQSSGIHP